MRKIEKNISVLIADDDRDFREFVRVALKKIEPGCNLCQVEDGEELMDYLCLRGKYQNPEIAPAPKLVFLDLNMPKKNGLEALREIRENPELRKIPIIMLSISEDPKDILQSYMLGANTFNSKPNSLEALVTTLQAIKKYWCEIAQLP